MQEIAKTFSPVGAWKILDEERLHPKNFRKNLALRLVVPLQHAACAKFAVEKSRQRRAGTQYDNLICYAGRLSSSEEEQDGARGKRRKAHIHWSLWVLPSCDTCHKESTTLVRWSVACGCSVLRTYVKRSATSRWRGGEMMLKSRIILPYSSRKQRFWER